MSSLPDSHFPAATLLYGKRAMILAGDLDLAQHPHFQGATWKWPVSGIVLHKVTQWVGAGCVEGVCLPSLNQGGGGAGTIIPPTDSNERGDSR